MSMHGYRHFSHERPVFLILSVMSRARKHGDGIWIKVCTSLVLFAYSWKISLFSLQTGILAMRILYATHHAKSEVLKKKSEVLNF